MDNTSEIYKVTFLNQGKVYEIYARSIDQGSLFGFIEIEELVFGERTSLVVDPSEERLKTEFESFKSEIRLQTEKPHILRLELNTISTLLSF